MRPELQRLILNARARLGEYALSSDEAEDNARRQAIENFQVVLAGKIALSTSLLLFWGGDYLWLETRPAMRFEIDGHTFLLAAAKQECELLEECGGQLLPLARLALSDPSFEDRLLVAVGAVLEPRKQ